MDEEQLLLAQIRADEIAAKVARSTRTTRPQRPTKGAVLTIAPLPDFTGELAKMARG
jgi:hypothetical protein